MPHFSVSLALSSIGPLAPFLQEAFQINRAQIGVLTSAQSVGSIAMATVSGSIVERFGIRSWIFLSQAAAGICAFFIACTSSFTLGMVFFLVMGFAFSFVNPATTKAIIIFFPHVRRGTAIAVKQCGVPAGALLAAALLPALAIFAGWEKSMLAVALIAVLGAAGGWLLYPDRDDHMFAVKAGKNGPPGQHDFRKDFGRLLRNKDFLLTSVLQGVFNLGQFVIR
ncbi:MAG: MFS transporter, partial [Bacillota bacterium]